MDKGCHRTLESLPPWGEDLRKKFLVFAFLSETILAYSVKRNSCGISCSIPLRAVGPSSSVRLPARDTSGLPPPVKLEEEVEGGAADAEGTEAAR